MEAQPALVGTDGGIHLHPVTPVDMDFSLVIHPGNPEDYRSFRFGKPLQDRLSPVLRMTLQHR